MGIDLERLVIRRAGRKEVPAIVGLMFDDLLGSRRESPAPSDAHYRAFDRMDADPSHLLLVAELDGGIVGTFHLTFIPGLSFEGGTRAQIEEVRVAAALRGQGVGARMMLWAIDRARREGCRLVQLTTNRAREDAHRFYERLGFLSSHVGLKLDLQAEKNRG